jgi:uncharacterized protein YkwD
MDRRRTTALAAAPLVWLTLVAGPAAAAEDQPCLTAVVLCAEEQPTTEAPPPPPPTTTTTTAPPPPPSEAEATAHLLRRMNEERTARGLPVLHRRDDVDGVAQAWSGHLASERRLSHNDAFFTSESRARHGAKALGENVAVNRSAEAAHVALMNSPHHRDNILDARFTVVGLGAVYQDGSWWVTQDFVQPRTAPATAPAPRPVRAPAPAAPATAAPPRAPAPSRPASPPTPAVAAPAPADVVPVAAAATGPRPAVVQTLRTEPDVPARTGTPTLATQAATPTPRTALVAAVAAAAGWVVLAAARRRIRRAASVIPR